MLEPGWLERQFDAAQQERERWPEWLRRARELRTPQGTRSVERIETPQSNSQENAAAVALARE